VIRREPRCAAARHMPMTRFAALLVVLVSPLLAGCGAALLGAGNVSAGSANTTLQITRTPGLFILPALDQTIADPSTINRLQADIDHLPAFPPGAFSCPIDFGTTYKLIFKLEGAPTETAVISVLGCRGVTLGDGRALWAMSSPTLFTDLGAALGLTPDELAPLPCPGPHGTVCYAQPSA
jgi:hypothetical protein